LKENTEDYGSTFNPQTIHLNLVSGNAPE